MLGTISGLIGGLANGLMGSGNNGDGMLSGIGDIAGKLLDPLGLFSGGEEQSTGNDEITDILADIQSLLEELLAEFSGQEETTDDTSDASDASGCPGPPPPPGGPIYIDGGSGDDVITIGQPVTAE